MISKENIDIFANGGDRNEGDIPESEICKNLTLKCYLM